MKALSRASGAAALSLLLGGCAVPTGEQVLPPAAAEQVGVRADGWQQYNGGYDATRFSPLTQINTGNAASL
jgi:glucose dehydrogenase